MKRVLLPTDFSENSINAIEYAVQIFKEEPCTFYLLNTYTPTVYHLEYVLSAPDQYGVYDIKEASLKKMAEIESTIKAKYNNAKHSFTCISEFNTLIDEINNQILQYNIDLVVMGTKGATGAKEVLFGSSTVHTLKKAKCPVLAVPEGFSYEKPLEILFPTDYEIDYKERQTKTITNIAEMHHSRINVLHVTYGYELSEQQEKNKKKLTRFFNNTTYLVHEVSNQNITEAINNFQIKNKVNMLIMINNKHSFFENIFFKKIINQIGFHVKIPFLVIPSYK